MRFTLKRMVRHAASSLAVPMLALQSALGATEDPSALALPTPIIRSWGTEAGLPQNSVNAMVQTRDGYLWLATRDGLARFDGIRFKVYGLEQGLPSVDISSLLEDHEGALWIGTLGSGLCRLTGGTWKQFPRPFMSRAVTRSIAWGKMPPAGCGWVQWAACAAIKMAGWWTTPG